MFGRSKPVVFDPYRRSRSRWRLPRWLVLLLLGVVAGGAAVVYVQERHLPPRLSADASTRLQAAYDAADAERMRLRQERDAANAALQRAVAERTAAVGQAAADAQRAERLAAELRIVVAALPDDPRGGAVQVRAGQFGARGASLDYTLVLTSGQGSAARPLAATLQIVATGDNARGVESSAPLAPVSLTIAGHQVTSGSLALPEGFRARQATVRILDRAGASLGMRVFLVR